MPFYYSFLTFNVNNSKQFFDFQSATIFIMKTRQEVIRLYADIIDVNSCRQVRQIVAGCTNTKYTHEYEELNKDKLSVIFYQNKIETNSSKRHVSSLALFFFMRSTNRPVKINELWRCGYVRKSLIS